MNTHYRWVAQLWSIEECWQHGAKGPAQPEDTNTADRFRSRASAAQGASWSFPGFVRSCHRIPPQLHRPIGKRRKKPFAERAIQSFAIIEASPFATAPASRETNGLGGLDRRTVVLATPKDSADRPSSDCSRSSSSTVRASRARIRAAKHVPRERRRLQVFSTGVGIYLNPRIKVLIRALLAKRYTTRLSSNGNLKLNAA